MARRKPPKRTTDKRKLLAMEWQELLKRHGITPTQKTHSNRKPGEKYDFVPMTSYNLQPFRRDENAPVKISRPTDTAPVVSTPKPVYEGEMAVREQRAQEEIARKRKQIAPICNKGAYQYISNPEDWKTVGRKV